MSKTSSPLLVCPLFTLVSLVVTASSSVPILLPLVASAAAPVPLSAAAPPPAAAPAARPPAAQMKAGGEKVTGRIPQIVKHTPGAEIMFKGVENVVAFDVFE